MSEAAEKPPENDMTRAAQNVFALPILFSFFPHRLFHTTAFEVVNMEQHENQIILRGDLLDLPEHSHENHGKAFCRFLLEVPRLSGAVDTLPVVAEEATTVVVVPLILEQNMELLVVVVHHTLVDMKDVLLYINKKL
jgi:hypothetical protein